MRDVVAERHLLLPKPAIAGRISDHQPYTIGFPHVNGRAPEPADEQSLTPGELDGLSRFRGKTGVNGVAHSGTASTAERNAFPAQISADHVAGDDAKISHAAFAGSPA
jgi:hypothetical protein